MPPRNPELPEGTDQIVTDEGGQDGGFVARGGAAGTSGTTDKLVSQVREQVTSLRGQAGDKLRGFADDGKSRATGVLEDVASIIEDAARSIDERLGNEYGDYAHRASGAVSDFAGRFRERSVDELLDDGRDLVRKSPTVAVAAAAVVGFALIRVFRTGLEEAGGTRRGGNGARRRRASNADTTTGGGA